MAKKENGGLVPFENPPGIEGFDKFEDEQVGLPPYWGPDDENLGPPDDKGFSKPLTPMQFYGKVVAYDDGDPEFKRYVIQAGHDLLCWRGPKKSVEEVPVKKYEFFSISEYAGLPLGRYLGLPIFVYVKGKRPIAGGRTVWEWGVKCDPRVKAKLEERREKMIANAYGKGTVTVQADLPPRNTAPALPERSRIADDDIPF